MKKHSLKWWLNGVGAVIFVLLAVVYFLIPPIIVQNLEPVLKQKLSDRVNGTITWDALGTDLGYDLYFTNLTITDANGVDVFKAPGTTVAWSASAVYDYVKNGGGVSNIIKGVTVENPVVYVGQKDDGTWNVENLIKPSDTPDNGTFTGKVSITNGTATVTVKDVAQPFEFGKLNANLKWDAKQVMKGTFDGTSFGSHFEGNMKFVDSDNLEVDVDTGNIPLKELQPLLAEFPQVSKKLEIDKGTGQVTSAKIWKSDGTLAYHITGHVNKAALRYDTFVVADGAAFFDIGENHVELSNVSAAINGQKLTGDADINLAAATPSLFGHLFLDDVDVAKLYPDAGAAGSVSGGLLLSGTLDTPFVSGELTVKDGQYENLSVKRANVRFVYGENAISIPFLVADAMGGHVEGSGHYDMTTGAFAVDGAMDQVDLGQVPAGVDLAGHASGSVTAEGTFLNGNLDLTKANFEGEGFGLSYEGNGAASVHGFGSYDHGNWQGTAFGTGISYDDLTLDTVSGSASSNGNTIHIAYLTGSQGVGSFSLSGDYGDSVNMSATAAGLNIAPLSNFTGVDIAGTVDADVTVAGTRDSLTGNGHVAAADGHVRNFLFDRAEGDVSFNGGSAVIQKLTITGPHGNDEVSGTVGIAAPHALDLKVNMGKARIEDFLSLAGVDAPVTGYIQNTMTVKGTVDDPQVTGDFHAWSGSVMGQLFQSVSGEYSYDGNAVTIKDGLGYIYNGTVVADGTIAPDKIGLNIYVNDVSLSRVLPGKGIAGKVNLRGYVSGTTSSPEFIGTVSSRRIKAGGTAVDRVSAGMRYKDHMVTISDGEFYQAGGAKFQWNGSFNTENQYIIGRLKFDHWNIKEALKLFKLSGSGVDGTVEGGMGLRGTLDNPNVNFHANFLGGHLDKTPIGEGVIDFSYQNHALAIREFKIPVGNGLLAAQGTMNSAGDLDIQFGAKDVDISWLPTVLDKPDMKLGGTLTAGINLSGNKAAPTADVSIGLDHPYYGDIGFDNLSIMANAEKNVVTLQNAVVNRGQYKASAHGTMPGNLFTRSTTDPAVPMDIDVNLDNADLNILAMFLKPVTAAEGPIKGHLKIGGSYLDPQVFGGISIKNGSLSLTSMHEAISPIDLSLSFSGKEMDADGKAVFGGGALILSGNTTWDGMAISTYNGELHVHTPSINSDYYKGALDGDFTFGEAFGFPGVAGTLKVHDTKIDVPLSLLTSSEGGGLPMLCNITVDIGDNVFLYNPALYNLQIGGNVDVKGSLENPMVSGKVDVKKNGTVRINMTDFTIRQAHALWDGLPGEIVPDVHVDGTAKVGHYSIHATMDGPVGEMKTTFTSDPPLNDSQILLLLTLHQMPNANNNDGAMTGALFNAGLTMLFGNGIQDFLQDKIGLDLVSITSSLTDYYSGPTDTSKDNNYYIKIGKYIFNDFMLTATMGMNNDDQSIGGHYDLNSRVGVSSWYNTNHESYFGVDYGFRFDSW